MMDCDQNIKSSVKMKYIGYNKLNGHVEKNCYVLF